MLFTDTFVFICYNTSGWKTLSSKKLLLTVLILSDIYSVLNSFCSFCIQETSVLDGRFLQLVVLPNDGLVKPETCTCRNWWSL